MSLSNYDASIEDFLINIQLTESQGKRIDRALRAISGVFLTQFEGNVEIYVQGSFATNTTVKPITSQQSRFGPGEFDVDIVLEKSDWSTPASALEEIEDTLRQLDDYEDRLSTTIKQSCVRLEYAVDANTGVGFHVDIVPIKKTATLRQVAVRDTNQWRDSDSVELINWTKNLQTDNPYITATVLAIKRMRDMAGLTEVLASIVLFSMLETAYLQADCYAEDLLMTIDSIRQMLELGLANLRITNPVNRGEDLITKWRDNPGIYKQILKFFTDVHVALMEGFNKGYIDDLKEVLSDDFPAKILPPNVESMRSQSITVAGAAEIKKGGISPNSEFGTKTNATMWVFFERAKNIVFQATGFNKDEELLWQVCNAPGSEMLRGDYFEARGLHGGPGTSPYPHINNENEKYPGTHWVRYIGVNENNQLVTISSKFYVKVHGLPNVFVPKSY